MAIFSARDVLIVPIELLACFKPYCVVDLANHLKAIMIGQFLSLWFQTTTGNQLVPLVGYWASLQLVVFIDLY